MFALETVAPKLIPEVSGKTRGTTAMLDDILDRICGSL